MSQILFLSLIASLALQVFSTKQSLAQWRGDTRSPLSSIFDSLATHPSVLREDAQIEAQKRAVSMESSWMDPMLMLGLENVPAGSFRFDQDPMTGKMVGITQHIPFPGKLSKSRELGEQRVTAASLGRDERLNLLERQIAVSFYDMYPIRKGIETNELHLAWYDQMIKSAENRLKLGRAPQQEVLQLEIGKAEVAQEIESAKAMLAMKQSDFEYAAGESEHVRSILSQAGRDSLGLPDFPYTLDQLYAIAAETNPEARRMTARAEGYSLERDRRALDRYPDFDVTLSYMNRSTLSEEADMNPMKWSAEPMPMHLDDMLSLSVSFPIPLNLNNQQTDREEELTAMKNMELREREAMLREIRSMIKARLALLESLRKRHLILTHQIVPLVQELTATGDANYTYGKIDLVTLLNNRLSYLHRIHEVYQVEADYNKSIVEIEYLVGRQL